MVHALRRAGQRLRSGGSLISIRPHETQLPLVSIITPSRRIPVTRLPTPGFDDRQSAADAALERVVAEGRFAIVGIVVVFLALTYNRLVTLRQRVKEAFSDIDVQLKRRHDLIPNLVETVKGYAAHERGVFDEVTQARAGAIAAGAQGPQQRAAAEDMLTGALRSLFAVAEAYPQLQAVQEFKDLSENLRDPEDKIQFARRFYNGQVRDYNTALQTFPTVVLAGAMGFTSSEYFEVEAPSDREVPKVSFTPSA